MADLGLYENFLEHARVTEAILHRRRSMALRNMEIAFEIPEPEFVGLFRLNKSVCLDLIQELEPYLPSRRGGMSTVSKVLSALSFYASGSYQRFIGASAHHRMHQVSVSNCVRAVTQAINNNHFRRKYINFPQTREERNIIKNGFYEKFGFPGVVGCIDGTHIAITKPAEFEERYFNRKRYHSLNAQIICDSDLNILSIDASHGGASHDAFIWNHHPLKNHLEQLHRDQNETLWFLGDSGYPLRPTLMTPIINTEPDSPQEYYTELHCRTRNTVERCIGVLKSRWRCLLVDRKLHYHPITAGLITNSCVVLHNICNATRLPFSPLSPQEEQREITRQIMSHTHVESTTRRNNPLAAGESERNALVAGLRG
ncbi:putative nuclease HARBI1 [Ostrinia furnacalis]|uniref:putative nuclease HARBI1 n=1 Tax=Ostrinia furnacalis TaxID=93504 RepID=UPI00103FFA4E|nr:putative nuclease HARBI1 [Ostrinia furnacalis]